MGLRLFFALVIVLGVYFAFGDFFHASTLATPSSVVADIGRGIGSFISGIATGISSIIWG